jgi:hypothetical protein
MRRIVGDAYEQTVAPPVLGSRSRLPCPLADLRRRHLGNSRRGAVRFVHPTITDVVERRGDAFGIPLAATVEGPVDGWRKEPIPLPTAPSGGAGDHPV